MAVVINFRHENVASQQVAEAELLFVGEEMGPLAGTKLVGFRIWRSPDAEGNGGELYVTFPSRAFGNWGNERRYFDFLRGTDGTVVATRRVKEWIKSEYRLFEQKKNEVRA